MTIYGPQDIARIWVRNGGAAAHMVDAVAICLAESGGNTAAVSPSSDYGLWQINSSNLAAFGQTTKTALDPDRSARMAISMSGNGTNWAAWCTAWADPRRNCGHGFIAHPEPGSAAYAQLGAAASALLIGVDGAISSGPTPNADSASGAWAYMQNFIGKDARERYGTIHTARANIQKVG